MASKLDRTSPSRGADTAADTTADDAADTAPDDVVAPRDEDDKVDSPGDLGGPGLVYVAKKTLREFSKDQCTDLAAALTYYAVLALFPAAIAVTSILGLVGQGKATGKVLNVVGSVAGQSTADKIRPTVEQLSMSSGAGIALILGILGALWSASGYVSSFSRAVNRIYERPEGRPVWKLRPVMLALTAVLLVLVVVALVLLVVTGPVSKSIGDQIGLGSTAVLVFDIAKWPVLLGIVVLIVALLYYVTPNVKQPKFSWISYGAVTAIVVWIVVSVAFAFYVANFGSYNKTYGALAGVIVFLLWLWLTNVSLLFGAELDAELERGRELVSGMPAEETIQLPPRDTKVSDKAAATHEDDVREGREIRERAERDGTSEQARTD